MDNADFTLTSTEETRAGAMACLEALRTIENIKCNLLSDDPMEAWWRGEDNAVAIMLQAAGKTDGFMAGFVAVFAEYFKLSFGGTPNLDVFEPEAAMTEEEKKASRVKFEEQVAEGYKKTEATEEDKEQAYQEAAAQRKSGTVLFASGTSRLQHQPPLRSVFWSMKCCLYSRARAYQSLLASIWRLGINRTKAITVK